MLIRVLLSVAMVMWSSVAFASPMSGDYGELLLAVDPSRRLVTGYFESYTGNGQFSCIFYLRGYAKGSVIQIKTWFPANEDPKSVIEGTLEEASVNGRQAVAVKLNEEHGGCWNVQRFATDPRPLQLSTAGDWREIRIVSSRRAYFYDQPREGTRRKAYVVRGNALRLYERGTGWVRAEYVAQGGTRTSGWVREHDLFRTHAPGE